MTENSASSAYATGDQMVTRYDAAVLGDLVNDDGTRATGVTLTGHANLAVALKDASGFVEAACLRGNRYQPSELAAMTGVNANFLQLIVCGLAMWRLQDRRSLRTLGVPAPLPEWVQKYLDDLSSGVAIFGFTQVQDAGVTSIVTRASTDADDLNRITTRAGRFFGNTD